MFICVNFCLEEQINPLQGGALKIVYNHSIEIEHFNAPFCILTLIDQVG